MLVTESDTLSQTEGGRADRQPSSLSEELDGSVSLSWA